MHPLSKRQQDVLNYYTSGNDVWDLGAGYGSLACSIFEKAKSVTCVDKLARPDGLPAKIKWQQQYFVDAQVLPSNSVAVVSWPVNRELPGLIPMLRDARVIIYIGYNFGGVSCGWPGFFDFLLHRHLVGESYSAQQAMLVYMGHLLHKRAPVEEERAGIDISRIYTDCNPTSFDNFPANG